MPVCLSVRPSRWCNVSRRLKISIFEVEYLKNTYIGQSYYRTVIGNHIQSIEYGTTFNDLD